jgi:glutamyl-tRNA reductase
VRYGWRSAWGESLGGEAIPFDQLAEGLKKADIVISSTGSMHPVITRELLRPVMRTRRGRPIFLIDIAVPRDIEPTAGDLDNVFLYNIDDLQQVVHKNLAVRQSEVERVEGIIEEEVRRFQGWLRGLEVGPTIAELQQEMENIRRAEVERLGGRLSHLSERDRAVVDALVRGVVNKIVRRPILRLRDAAASGNGYHEVEAVRAIFGLGQRTGEGQSREAAPAPEREDTGAPSDEGARLGAGAGVDREAVT